MSAVAIASIAGILLPIVLQALKILFGLDAPVKHEVRDAIKIRPNPSDVNQILDDLIRLFHNNRPPN